MTRKEQNKLIQMAFENGLFDHETLLTIKTRKDYKKMADLAADFFNLIKNENKD